MQAFTVDRNEGRWRWKFWKINDGEEREDEIIIYSPYSYTSEIEEYFVVVKFKLEGKDWWLCQFQDNPSTGGEVLYIRVNNYQDQLREAMITCHAMNKMIGAC